MKNIYKLGDRVYRDGAGWGVVFEVLRNKNIVYPVSVEFDNGIIDQFTLDGKESPVDLKPVLSFSEYDLSNDGFNQERPRENIKEGQGIFVRNNSDHDWELRRFICWNGKEVRCYAKNSTDKETAIDWAFYKLDNPYK